MRTDSFARRLLTELAGGPESPNQRARVLRSLRADGFVDRLLKELAWSDETAQGRNGAVVWAPLGGDNIQLRELVTALRALTAHREDLVPGTPGHQAVIAELSGDHRPDWAFVESFLADCVNGNEQLLAVMVEKVRPLWEVATSSAGTAEHPGMSHTAELRRVGLTTVTPLLEEITVKWEQASRSQELLSGNSSFSTSLLKIVENSRSTVETLVHKLETLNEQLVGQEEENEELRAELQDTRHRLQAAHHQREKAEQFLDKAKEQRDQALLFRDAALSRLRDLLQHKLELETVASDRRSDGFGVLSGTYTELLDYTDDRLAGDARTLDSLKDESYSDGNRPSTPLHSAPAVRRNGLPRPGIVGLGLAVVLAMLALTVGGPHNEGTVEPGPPDVPPHAIVLTGHSGAVRSVAFRRDGLMLGSGGDDRTVRFWDVAGHKQVAIPLTGHSSAVRSVAFEPQTGRFLATGGSDAKVYFWDSGDIKELDPILSAPGRSGWIWSIAFSPDGRSLVTASGSSSLLLWDVASRKPSGAPFAGHRDSVFSVAFSPDGRTLATGSQDRTVRLWDVATRRKLGAPLTGHTRTVTSVAFSPDGRILATGSLDSTVRLWDVATHRQLGVPFAGHAGNVNSAAFSPDGRTLATANGDGTVRLWDIATHKPVGKPLTGHKGPVLCVAFSPNGRILASGSTDKTIRLWPMRPGA